MGKGRCHLSSFQGRRRKLGNEKDPAGALDHRLSWSDLQGIPYRFQAYRSVPGTGSQLGFYDGYHRSIPSR